MFFSRIVRNPVKIDLGGLQQQYADSFQTKEEQEIDYNPFYVNGIQSYNPIMSSLVDTDTDTVTLDNNVVINHKYHLQDLDVICSLDRKRTESIPVYIKYAPLLDPVHYLIGKYEKVKSFIRIPNSEDARQDSLDIYPKLREPNNASYVDCFFNYLCSQLLHNHGFVNGIDFYGSYLTVQHKFKINLADDYEYLYESKFFHQENGKIYEMENKSHIQRTYLENGDTHDRRPKLNFITEDNDIGEIIMDDVVDIEVDDSGAADDSGEVDEIFCTESARTRQNDDDVSDSDDDTSSTSSNNSVLSDSTEYNTDDDESDEDDDGSDDDGSDDDSENSSDSDEEPVNAYLYNFPVQMICLEKCEGTLDDLLEKEKLSLEEQSSALAQVIFALLILQKTFAFTHNDLHSNNIVYKYTSLTHIDYVYRDKTYRVPTFGKLYKIIDFGRAIFRYGNKIYASDSFAKGGDAHGQYNTEPYMNEKKPRIEPNMSFDLCRLGCSLHDFYFDDDIYSKYSKNINKMNVIEYTILRWCTDDRGKNILYKASSGEERYPNFKLYKMIARHVHGCTPEQELTEDLIMQYDLSKPQSKKNKRKNNAKQLQAKNNIEKIVIDQIPQYYGSV